jgi:transcription initiation factor IIE alpha subunit
MNAILQEPETEQARRLRTKSQDHCLQVQAVEGAGLTPWEAKELVNVVREVYFRAPEDQPLRNGEIFHECVAVGEGAGKPLERCRRGRVRLLVFSQKEDHSGACGMAGEVRQRRILRLTDAARDQGGLLTQEDLAYLLSCDVRTVRRDIRAFRDQGIHVPTRGQQEDIGPTVSHRALALRYWLEGDEPFAVARRINHSLHAVERYIQHFSRTVYLVRKQFHPLQIAMTVGISTMSVRTYLDIYDQYAKRPEFRRRWDEIDLVGAASYEAKDAEKGGPWRGGKSREGWRKA